MNIIERAQKILTEIDAALALAEKATKGPWSTQPDHLWVAIADKHNQKIAAVSASGRNPNATFIASSRTLLPASLRCLKTAIEGMLNAHAMLLKHDWDAHEITVALTTLCDQWEEMK